MYFFPSSFYYLIMSDSIDETAGTPSLSLAAVVTHSRGVVVCPGWASPEKRNRSVYARWYQVDRYPLHNTNPTLKPRYFLLPCRLLLPYSFFLPCRCADVFSGVYQLETRFARNICFCINTEGSSTTNSSSSSSSSSSRKAEREEDAETRKTYLNTSIHHSAIDANTTYAFHLTCIHLTFLRVPYNIHHHTAFAEELGENKKHRAEPTNSAAAAATEAPAAEARSSSSSSRKAGVLSDSNTCGCEGQSSLFRATAKPIHLREARGT